MNIALSAQELSTIQCALLIAAKHYAHLKTESIGGQLCFARMADDANALNERLEIYS